MYELSAKNDRLMLVRYDQFIIQTCESVQKRHKIHLKSSVTGSEFPRLAIIILRDYKGHIIDFVCHAVIEDHVFRSCFRISESIADIKPKCMSIYIAVPGTPVPSVIICPHTSSPVERSEMFFRVKFVPLSIIFCKTFRAHTIDFLVIIESSFFVPRCCDNHRIHLGLLQPDVAGEWLALIEVIKLTDNMTYYNISSCFFFSSY